MPDFMHDPTVVEALGIFVSGLLYLVLRLANDARNQRNVALQLKDVATKTAQDNINLQAELDAKTRESALANEALIRQQVTSTNDANRVLISRGELILEKFDALQKELNEITAKRTQEREVYLVESAQLKTRVDSLAENYNLQSDLIAELKDRQAMLEGLLRDKQTKLDDTRKLLEDERVKNEELLRIERSKNEELQKEVQTLTIELERIRQRLSILEGITK
jgi:hypothetical protein